MVRDVSETSATGRNTGKASFAAAKSARDDEFYTQLSDVERELRHYEDQFRGKVVYCNADDPRVSAFFRYFSLNFERLGLAKLIATCYRSQERDLFSQGDAEQAVYLEYTGDKNNNRVPDPEEVEVKPLAGDGDFRSPECVGLLQGADIVVTNPPFSLFREYVAQLVKHQKSFIILGPPNAITYKEIFPLIQDGRLWLGNPVPRGSLWFDLSAGAEKGISKRDPTCFRYEDGRPQARRPAAWFTNLDYPRRHEELPLFRQYNPINNPTYDNYEAIEVGNVADIPADHDGVMGVPITFLNRYNPDQFEIVGIAKAPLGQASKVYPRQTQVKANGDRSTVTKLNDGPVLKVDKPPVGKTFYEVDGKNYVQLYARLLIKRRK